MSRTITLAAALALAVAGAPLLAAAPAAAADGRNAAFVGGLAAGAVGGVLLGQALAPQPVYAAPAPVYAAPPPTPVAYDPYFDQMTRLHMACDAGNRSACVHFGVIIGEHREKMAEWRRLHPDFFTWERY
ncbi:hypothetical protein [Labrys wisconsinensis]|uniref:Uncharacterized protein n=1 Tax=Labrys wisconsinensis TaxID=425677 RepID=A0ABU0J1Z8_9HYPH|nr:hypothetical protein [Labrys wisconsinensis]MDQ0468280.1 hypothetical protein [Labrys wisconsinensis]